MPIAFAHQASLSTAHIGRIAHGADIHHGLLTYCRQHEIHQAWVNVLGAVQSATLAYYNQQTHQYELHPFTGGLEITNGTGNISLKEGQPFAHIHLTLSDNTGKALGGHLMPDTSVVFACEFMLWPLDSEAPLMRCGVDEQTGLSLWQTPH